MASVSFRHDITAGFEPIGWAQRCANNINKLAGPGRAKWTTRRVCATLFNRSRRASAGGRAGAQAARAGRGRGGARAREPGARPNPIVARRAGIIGLGQAAAPGHSGVGGGWRCGPAGARGRLDVRRRAPSATAGGRRANECVDSNSHVLFRARARTHQQAVRIVGPLRSAHTPLEVDAHQRARDDNKNKSCSLSCIRHCLVGSQSRVCAHFSA